MSICSQNSISNIRNDRYIDAIIKPRRDEAEVDSLITMMEHSVKNDKAIILADSNYSTYNLLAHIENQGLNFVIRGKDITAKNGLLSNVPLPDTEEFDTSIELNIVRKSKAAYRNKPNFFKYLSEDYKFDYLQYGADEIYTMKLRAIRTKISDEKYCLLFTNLSPDTLYNFCSVIMNRVLPSSVKKEVHRYKANTSAGFFACQKFLSSSEFFSSDTLSSYICEHLSAIRNNRSFKRALKTKKNPYATYR